nr:ERAD-associated E3 ubiquitin-protein ligase component HRD3A-like [Tanacetum cinerariifolium]
MDSNDIRVPGDNIKFGFLMAFTKTLLSWNVLEFSGDDFNKAKLKEMGHAQIGNTVAMYKISISYYGLRGLNCDHAKALSWFSKAVNKGEPRSIEILGKI